MNQVPPHTQMEELKAEIATLTAEQEACVLEARQLLEREVRGEGVFAQEMHQLKQKKQMLGASIQHVRVRLNWLRLNMEEGI